MQLFGEHWLSKSALNVSSEILTWVENDWKLLGELLRRRNDWLTIGESEEIISRSSSESEISSMFKSEVEFSHPDFPVLGLKSGQFFNKWPGAGFLQALQIQSGSDGVNLGLPGVSVRGLFFKTGQSAESWSAFFLW